MNSTAQHVADSFNSRTEAARSLLNLRDSDNEQVREDVEEELSELPLSIDRKVLVTITLGLGGPSDWIDAVCTVERETLELESATYTAVWGSDKEVTELRDTDALWQLAEYYVESLEA